MIGREVPSDSGFPEGDSMSCLAMIVALFSFHRYFQVFEPTISAYSYVDNLELVSSEVMHLVRGHLTLQAWTEMMTLHLDQSKTLAWAAQAADRRLLQLAGFAITEGTKDLGASMCYGSRHRNRTLQRRILSTKVFFEKLRRSNVSTWHKLQILHVALFPRALFGADAAILGHHWITKLRTWTMRSLGFARPGASPLIRLAWICPVNTDPGFVECWNAWSSFQRQLHKSTFIRKAWVTFVEYAGSKGTYGPFAKIFALSSTLGWSLSHDLVLRISDGCQVPFLSLDRATLKHLVTEAWFQVIARSVRLRKDFSDLEGIDHAATFGARNTLSHAEQALLSCAQDGTMFLNTFKSKFDPSRTCLCDFCGQEDTLAHRALTCPHFETARRDFEDCVACWHCFPSALTHHGLAGANPWIDDFHSLLLQIPWEPTEWHSSPCGIGTQRIFTDGSCSHPKVPCCALAAWACVHEDSGQTLASGLLPGLRLHNNRAELFAVYVAVLWSKHFFCDVDIFTDSSYVVRGWDALLRTRHVSFDCTNSDLWELLWQAMLVHENTVRLYKTEAHLDQTLLTDANSAWQAHWNSVADLSAKTARRTAGCARLRQVHERLIRTYEWHRHWALRYQAFLLSLAQRSMSTSTTESMHDDDSALNLFNWCSQNPGDLFDELPLDLASLISQSVKLRDFGLPIALKLATWLSRLDTAATHLAPVSYLEVFVAFSSEFDVVLPVQVGTRNNLRWQDPFSRRAGGLLQRTLVSQVKVFRYLFDSLCVALGFVFDGASVSYPQFHLHLSLDARVIPWPTSLVSVTLAKLGEFFQARPLRSSQEFARHWP